MSRPDMALYMMWEDSKKETYKVGMLAQTEDGFYLAMRNKEKMTKAFENGYIGIPGLKAGEIYKSPRIFDFIERRVGKGELNNPCEALINRNGGRSLVDSYFFEPVSKGLVESKIKGLKDSYEYQEKLRAMNSRNDFE